MQYRKYSRSKIGKVGTTSTTSTTSRKATGTARALCAAAMLLLSACADIWGFDELRAGPDSGVSPDAGGLPVVGDGTGGSRGGGAETGAGGSASPAGAGGVRGGASAGGAGGSAGSGGASGSGGSGVGGMGGRAGAAGSGGVGSGGSGGGATGGRAGSGGTAGSGATGGRTGSGGAGGTGVCASGTNRCVGGDLETCSATGAWQSTGTSTHQLLVNPGFESGVTGWTTSVAGGFPLVYVATGASGDSPEVSAQSPPNVTWFGGYNRGDDIASQSVVIPADATSISVSFYYAIFTRESGSAENDVMDVTVTTGAQTTTLAHFSNTTPVANWTRFSTTLPATLAGQTVRLQFRDLTNATVITSFYVDTVALQVVACP